MLIIQIVASIILVFLAIISICYIIFKAQNDAKVETLRELLYNKEISFETFKRYMDKN